MSYLIHHFLESSADSAPTKEAVVHGSQRFTYLDIERRANAIANWLLGCSISKGERVAVLLRNSVEYICSYYGVLKAGGVIVPLNTGLEARELGRILADCSAEIMISENHFAKRIQEIRKVRAKPWKLLVMVDDNNSRDDIIGEEYTKLSDVYSSYSKDRPHIHLIDQDLSSIIYTSGSTGRPKGVMLTHLNVVTNTMSIIPYLRLAAADRCMVVLPFYYVYGKSLLNTHFAVSGTVIIDSRFAYPNAVLKKIIEEKATGFAGVPSTYSILVKKSSAASMNFPDLRYITQAGGHMPAEIKERLLKIFSNKEIYIMYGATEASARLSYLEPEALPSRINAIGKPIPNVELKIFTEDGLETRCEEEGEIVARGSNIMKGYWNDDEGTKKVLKDGWYYTGDLGVKDKDGFFYVTGRRRDMIKIGIYKVSAIEIEEVLARYPGIQETAVIGVPDSILGEAARAVVVGEMNAKLDPKDMIRFCSEVLPTYKVPKDIVFTETLPKNGAGKILKNKLKELL